MSPHFVYGFLRGMALAHILAAPVVAILLPRLWWLPPIYAINAAIYLACVRQWRRFL